MFDNVPCCSSYSCQQRLLEWILKSNLCKQTILYYKTMKKHPQALLLLLLLLLCSYIYTVVRTVLFVYLYSDLMDGCNRYVIEENLLPEAEERRMKKASVVVVVSSFIALLFHD